MRRSRYRQNNNSGELRFSWDNIDNNTAHAPRHATRWLDERDRGLRVLTIIEYLRFAIISANTPATLIIGTAFAATARTVVCFRQSRRFISCHAAITAYPPQHNAAHV